ncbi:hypothetical protein DFH06DRAFT_56455 [Mycena polygramma]|nr:hypothetical protein DFH06DRAFT_56455 [Mycena polygramma]
MTTRAAQPQPHFSVVDWHADHPHYGDGRKALPSASHLREPAHPIPARRRRPDSRRPSEPDQVSLFCHGRLGSNVTAQTIVAGGVNDQEHGPNTYPAVWRRVFFRPLHYRQPSHPKSHPPAKLPGLTTEHSHRVQEDIAPWFHAQWLRRSDVGATPLNAGVHAGRSSGRIGGSFVARRGGVVHARRHTGTARRLYSTSTWTRGAVALKKPSAVSPATTADASTLAFCEAASLSYPRSLAAPFS